MSEEIIIALIGFIGAVLGAVIVGSATITASSFRKGERPFPCGLLGLFTSIGAAVGLVLGVLLGAASVRQTPREKYQTVVPQVTQTVTVPIATAAKPIDQSTAVTVAPTQPPLTLSPCVGLVTRWEVDTWAKVGSTDKATVQRYISGNFGGRMERDVGFAKGDTVPAGVLIATDFGNGESEVYMSYPVKPVVHYRSWGLFETIGSFVAQYPGACLIIRE